MKEQKKSKNKGVFITLGIAAILIALCAVVLNTLLAHAAEPAENDIHTDPIVQTLNTDDVDLPTQDELNMIVYLNGMEAPSDAVTPQYATAVVSEIAERVFSKPLIGRVFIRLLEPYGAGNGFVWSVDAEVDGGSVCGFVNTETGTEMDCYYIEGPDDWAWFDNWNEETIGTESKEDAEQNAPATDLPLEEEISEEEKQQLMEMKRAAMLEFAATVADASYGDKAVELVNALGIGDGANAVSGAIMMGDSDPGNCTTYKVEVQLDNGKYVFVTLTVDDMSLIGYERSDVSMAEYYYG